MAKIKCDLLTTDFCYGFLKYFTIFFCGVELYLNGGQGERCCFIYCLGLAGMEALDVAEIPEY